MFCRQMIANAKSTPNTNFYYYLFDGMKAILKNKKVYLFADSIGENNLEVSQSFFGESRRTSFYGKVGINNYKNAFLTFDVTNYEALMSSNMIKIDESEFDKYFSNIHSTQLSVYIEDYAYTDEVINEINSLGYTAMSSFRASTLEYDMELLNSRNVTIIVCVIAVFVIFVLTLFVLVAFLSLNQGDYLLLRLIGMDKKTMYWTNLFEMLSTTFVMFIVSIIVTYTLEYFDISLIHNIIKYMVWYQFIIIFIVNLFIVWVTTSRFNNSLQKKTKTGFNE